MYCIAALNELAHDDQFVTTVRRLAADLIGEQGADRHRLSPLRSYGPEHPAAALRLLEPWAIDYSQLSEEGLARLLDVQDRIITTAH